MGRLARARRAAYLEGVRRFVSDEVLERIAIAARDACAREPNVAVAYLHGSAARSEPAADIDIGILLDEPVTARAAADACERIAAATEAEASPGLALDVRALNGAGPVLRFHAMTEGRRVFERTASERIVIEAAWASEWHDFEPFWRRQVERVLRRSTG
jgi:predicted nucleotidyltransferase